MNTLLFTLEQAVLSSLISLSLGLGIAWCLATCYPRIARYLKGLLALPFLTPTVVGLLAYISLFGQSGPFRGVLPLYGLGGIVGAHIFFYTPFIALFLWQGWQQIPAEHDLLAQQLRLSPWKRFSYIEWPILRPYFLTIGWLTFCMYSASFTTVLVLGGGPQSTTIPVALYQSLFHTMEFSQAQNFAILQIGVCILTYLITLFSPQQHPSPSGQTKVTSPSFKFSTGLAVTFTILFAMPLGILFVDSLPHLTSLLTADILAPLGTSLLIAFTVGPLSTLMALILLSCNHRLAFLGSLALITPLSLLGFAGLWLKLTMDNIPDLAFVIVFDIFLTLPFALHFLKYPLIQVTQSYKNLSNSLGLSPWQYTRLILIPLLRKPLGQSLGFCAAMAAADLVALLMFASPDLSGLSSLLYQQMQGYRSGESLATALLLTLTCLGLMGLFQFMLKDKSHAQS